MRDPRINDDEHWPARLMLALLLLMAAFLSWG